MIICISVLPAVISSFLFLIFLIWFFSLCFLMSLVNGLSILFIFSGNKILALLIFAMVSFGSFSFISALIFMIYLLLLTLRFLIYTFSSCFNCKVRLFDFSLVSWGKFVLLWNFPLALLLLNPIGLGLSFHFHLFLCVFWFPLWFLLWFISYSEACCLAAYVCTFNHFLPVKERKKLKSLSHVWLFATPWTVAHRAPLSMGFSRQDYWSGLTFPSPGDLPNPEVKTRSPTLQTGALPSESPGKPNFLPVVDI